MVEQVLASHPRVHGAGELNAIRDLYRALPDLTGRRAPGVECVPDLTRDHVRTLAGRYLAHVRGPAGAADRVVDKMPDNYLMLGLIYTLFPNATIIHTRRDVRDTGLSLYLTHFRGIGWAMDLEQIAHRINDYSRLMAHWRAVLPGRFVEVGYEQLVGEFEPRVRSLVSDCDLDWDPACLRFHETPRSVRTASMTQVREPIYSRSVRRWERYRDDLEPMLRILRFEQAE